MIRRAATLALLVLTGITVLIVGGFIWLRTTGTEVARPLVIRVLEQVTGREVTIAGDFDLRLLGTPALLATDIAIANAPWASSESMIEIETAEFEFKLWPLIVDRVFQVEWLRLTGAELHLERQQQHGGNWRFSQSDPDVADDGQGRLLLNNVEIVRSRVIWSDQDTGYRQTVLLDNLGWRTNAETERLVVWGKGSSEEMPLRLDGTIGSLANLLRVGDPYPVNLTIELGDISLGVNGRLSESATRPDSLRVSLHGPSVAALAHLLPVELPALGAYRLEATLINGPADELDAENMFLEIGTSGRPLLTAVGRARNLGDEATLNLRVSAQGSSIGSLAAFFGYDFPIKAAYQVEGTLVGGLSSLDLRQLKGALNGPRHQVNISGAIRDLMTNRAIDVQVKGSGLDAFQFLPENVSGDDQKTISYDLQAQITGQAESGYQLQISHLNFGGSDVRGKIAATGLESEDLTLKANLQSNLLQLGTLLEQRPTAQEPAPAASDRPDRLFEDDPFPFAILQMADGALQYRADKVLTPWLPLTGLNAAAMLASGKLRIDPFEVGIAGGQVSGTITIDTSAKPPAVRLDTSARSLQLAQLLSEGALAEKLTGAIGARINVNMTGHSMRDLMSSMDGKVVVVMDGGRLTDTQLNLLVADLDLFNVLPLLRRDKGYIDVNCFVGNFNIVNGKVDSDLLLDTDRMTIVGEGTILLDRESVNLELVPDAKSKKLSTIAVPIDIQGPLSRPVVKPRTGSAVGQAAIGAIGGLLVPLNLLASMLGGGQDQGQCISALRGAQTEGDPN